MSFRTQTHTPAAEGSPQAGDRLPGRCSHSRCQGRTSGLSRPLNSRERARARHLARDWLFVRGRRRPIPDARFGRPFPSRPSRQRGRSDAWELGGGGASVKSSGLIGSLGTYRCHPERSLRLPHAQLVRMSLGQVREAATRVLRVRKSKSAPAIHLLLWFGYPRTLRVGGQACGQVSVRGEAGRPCGCPRKSKTMERGLGAGTPDYPSLRP